MAAYLEFAVWAEVSNIEGDYPRSVDRTRVGGQVADDGLVETFCELEPLFLGQRVFWVEEDYSCWVPSERILGEDVRDCEWVGSWDWRC